MKTSYQKATRLQGDTAICLREAEGDNRASNAPENRAYIE